MWGAALCPKSVHPPNKAHLPDGASRVQTAGVTTQSSRLSCSGPPGLGGWPLMSAGARVPRECHDTH